MIVAADLQDLGPEHRGTGHHEDGKLPHLLRPLAMVKLVDRGGHLGKSDDQVKGAQAVEQQLEAVELVRPDAADHVVQLGVMGGGGGVLHQAHDRALRVEQLAAHVGGHVLVGPGDGEAVLHHAVPPVVQSVVVLRHGTGLHVDALQPVPVLGQVLLPQPVLPIHVRVEDFVHMQLHDHIVQVIHQTQILVALRHLLRVEVVQQAILVVDVVELHRSLVTQLYEAIEGIVRVQEQLAQLHVLAAEEGLDLRLPFLEYFHCAAGLAIGVPSYWVLKKNFFLICDCFFDSRCYNAF